MSQSDAKKVVTALLSEAGVVVNGPEPTDIQVHNQNTYSSILSQGSLGLGESYVAGWWDVEDLSNFIRNLLLAKLEYKIKSPGILWNIIKAKVFNQQSKLLSKRVAESHYDLGNDLYEKMLDKRMQYTCAYWKDARSLEEAQENKLQLVCDKLQIKSTDRILELGCGWGGFAKYAAEKYGCHVTAYNISKEQVAWAKGSCQGLPVDFKLKDYREAQGTFDKVVSIGLCEHVGPKNYRSYLQLIADRLNTHGIALVHTIGNNKTVYHTEPWLNKYIFPGSIIPSPEHLASAFDGILHLEDWHNFGPDYDRTLCAWFDNFEANWNTLKSNVYDDKFFRMWKYYLHICAGSFRARKNQLWQLVLSKDGIPGGYESVR